MFLPKLLLRLLWFFRRTAALFRQIRTFPQLFRFCSDLGILESDKLWEIQCWRVADGKDESWSIYVVRTTFRIATDCKVIFFAPCRTVLGVAKGFFWHVVKLGKRWGPETLWFFTLEKNATKSHLPKLISRALAVEATLAALKKWLPSRTACYNFVSVKNTSLSQECIIYSPPFGWAAIPYSPAKRSDSASQKQADTAKCFGKPP